MTAKYVTKASYVDQNFDYLPDTHEPVRTTVILESDDLTDTGLLDECGQKIFRMRDPMGFMRRS